MCSIFKINFNFQLNVKCVQPKQEESKPNLDDEWAGINFTVDNETGTYQFTMLESNFNPNSIDFNWLLSKYHIFSGSDWLFISITININIIIFVLNGMAKIQIQFVQTTVQTRNKELTHFTIIYWMVVMNSCAALVGTKMVRLLDYFSPWIVCVPCCWQSHRFHLILVWQSH